MKIYQILAVLSIAINACTANTVAADSSPAEVQPAAIVEINQESSTAAQTVNNKSILVDSDYDADDLTAAVVSEDTTTIEFDGEVITVKGSGADLEGNIVTISAAGTYQLSGTLTNGRIVVDSMDEGTVALILENVDIACSSNAPLYILNSKKTVITLADGTMNTLSDGVSYALENTESSEPNAAIFSNDDLTFNGNGSLTVHANYKHGIVSNDDLKIVSGSITVNAAADGIKGKNIVVVSGGDITVNAGNDGIQSYNAEDTDKGNLLIEGGKIGIVSGLDGIQAENSVEISSGYVNILAGGGYVNSTQQLDQGPGQMGGRGMPPQQSTSSVDESTDSTKGIKGNQVILISDGTITIDAADDALHSNGILVINDGTVQLSSGDDGMHADTFIEINGGNTMVLTSVEGVESADITINAGNLVINARDDGTNAISGDGMGGGRDDGSQLTINGGTLQINASGDGFDSNGDATIDGGVVIINIPISNGNGSLDVNGTFNVNSGTLIATGSAGMVEIPDDTSLQNTAAIVFDTLLPGGTEFRVVNTTGTEVISFVPKRDYQSIVVSSPDLVSGQSYTILVGGTQAVNFTISSRITTIGSFNSNMSGGKGGGQQPRGGG